MHVAQSNGWTPFSTMQCHYNLLYREDEREMLSLCCQYDVLPTPYSPLASGHLVRRAWQGTTLRATTDTMMEQKYNSAQKQDEPIVERVAQVAQKYGRPMAQIALAWHFVHGSASPIVGCSSPERVDQAVAALDVNLSGDDIEFLEEIYTAHELVGPINRPGEKPLKGTALAK